jgi:hypothetical protein
MLVSMMNDTAYLASNLRIPFLPEPGTYACDNTVAFAARDTTQAERDRKRLARRQSKAGRKQSRASRRANR